MFLLNDLKILEYVKDTPSLYLGIKDFEPKQLQHTSYYFRLGPLYSTRTGDSWTELSAKNQVLELKPGDYFKVQSFESFWLSEKIFGILGASSDIVSLGLRLVHAPFLDPLYDAPLVLALHNQLSETISVKFCDTLGKVCFFNISDTYPVRKRENSSFAKKLDYRSRMRESGVPDWVYDEDVVAFRREQEQQLEDDKSR